MQTGHADAARGFKCDKTGPDYSEGDDDKRRDHGPAPASEARNRLLEGGIILLPNDTVPHELQPRLGQPRPYVALRDDQDRNCHEKTHVGGEIQKKGLSWRGPERVSLQQRQHAHRNPGDQKETDDAPRGGLTSVTRNGDPICEPVRGPARRHIQLAFVGNDRGHVTIVATQRSNFSRSLWPSTVPSAPMTTICEVDPERGTAGAGS